jgi:hypothetical protein
MSEGSNRRVHESMFLKNKRLESAKMNRTSTKPFVELSKNDKFIVFYDGASAIQVYPVSNAKGFHELFYQHLRIQDPEKPPMKININSIYFNKTLKTGQARPYHIFAIMETMRKLGLKKNFDASRITNYDKMHEEYKNILRQITSKNVGSHNKADTNGLRFNSSYGIAMPLKYHIINQKDNKKTKIVITFLYVGSTGIPSLITATFP